jgi:hypothetical protein
MIDKTHGSDDPQQPNYKKGATVDMRGKQIASEALIGMNSRATITGGDLYNRSRNNYAKNAPEAPMGFNMFLPFR